MSTLTSTPDVFYDKPLETGRMRWLLNMSTRAKLMLGFGIMLLFLLGVIVTSYYGFTMLRSIYQDLYTNQIANELDLRSLRNNQNAIRADLLLIFMVDEGRRELILRDIESRAVANDGLIERLVARSQNDPQLQDTVERLHQLQTEARALRADEILPMLAAGNVEEARALILGEHEEINAQSRDTAEEFIEALSAQAVAGLAEAERQTFLMLVILIIAGILAVITSILLALLLERIIANPLRAVSGVAARISSGDLTVTLPPMQRSDEVGQLAEMFRNMIEALRELNREVREGVNVLSGSTGEIVAATTQLAVGTAETATAVSETTTTVEEVRQVAELTSQKAKYVADSAQRTLQVSETGLRSVETTIEGMNRIQAQMDSITDSIVRLSEHSQAIGEIIASVTDLADQSNLLAVNAAIEAAKAGEHGRGFAVVAQEVRSLAEQSKQATTQIRAILNDVQKATTSAVMAAEQGSRAVEAGVKLSGESGEAIRILADAIADAAQAATQIAASSQQQLVGMSQVAQAMENINQAGSQNAASTRQAETIARDLHELSRRLQQIVERYQV
jgi:methyl-accepting chemotaxis protein